MSQNFKQLLQKSKGALLASNPLIVNSLAEFGESTSFVYGISSTPFGKVLIAKTEQGISDLWFVNEEELFIKKLFNKYFLANFIEDNLAVQKLSDKIFLEKDLSNVNLCPKGTEFQQKVWTSLVKIPAGVVVSYADIAKSIEKPDAQRAVGTAIGKNPILYLIPCHRVIKSNGELGGFAAGTDLKSKLLGYEFSS
jgi:AraC family transcriptional regulator of adaptative response/methylated-DNA-[protein]-cysteine methyltransferase